MTDIQTERAFQKQHGVHLNSKRILSKKQTNTPRYHRAIGLGFKTPQAAIEGAYVDHKCPFTSNSISIRGIFFKGVVLSNKMTRTVILRRDYLHFIKKYNRFEKRHHNLPAHLSPAFARTQIGNVVTVGQCRPLSKTVKFSVVRVEKKRIEGNV